MNSRAGVTLAILFLAACRVEDSTRPRVFDLGVPSPGISDGSSGGNSEFFFYPPLTANPAGHPNFDAGGSNPGLSPYVVICELANPSDPNDCAAVVTPPGNNGGISLTYDASAESYRNNWKTSNSNLNSARLYRIEVFAVPVTNRLGVDASFINSFRYGYRDVDPDDGPPVSACAGQAFCKINNGSNVAIKVRIEQFASCPVTRTCASQFVASNQEANLQLPSGNLIQIPAQGGTNFFINFDRCSPAEEAAVDAAIDLPTFGPCFKTSTPFTGTLSDPALISICQPLDFIPAEYLAQKDQITLHHFDTGGDPDGPILGVEALPEAHYCPPTSSSHARARGPLGVLARVASGALSLFAPKPLYATTVALDVGGGGRTRVLGSLFKLALPGKFEFLNAADAVRVAGTGSVVTLQAKVTDLEGTPILGARVRWNVASSPGGGASLGAPTTVYTDASGVAQVALTLSTQPGSNIVHATGNGIADDRGNVCGAGANEPCNGPRQIGEQFGPFDPFIPLNHHLDGVLGDDAVAIATGTRLPFTVIGCAPGFGTPNAIDGVLAPGEWSCAQSVQFPVSLSGGSTTATLFWMNDATHMHFAVSVPGSGRDNSLRFDWDNNGNSAGLAQGSREVGDDIWEFKPPAGTADKYIDAKCSNSSQSGCGVTDNNHTAAGFRNDLGGVTVYELSHPLKTNEVKSGISVDIGAAAGQTLGYFITLRMGSGAQGNTQWPGFLKYRAITIK
jgi:hypothetical protein